MTRNDRGNINSYIIELYGYYKGGTSWMRN